MIAKIQPIEYEINVFPGEKPVIDHGEFVLENPTDRVVDLYYQSCTLLIGNQSIPMKEIKCYHLPNYDLLTNPISLKPKETAKIWVVFPSYGINLKTKFNETYSVELTFVCDNNSSVVRSKINLYFENENH